MLPRKTELLPDVQKPATVPRTSLKEASWVLTALYKVLVGIPSLLVVIKVKGLNVMMVKTWASSNPLYYDHSKIVTNFMKLHQLSVGPIQRVFGCSRTRRLIYVFIDNKLQRFTLSEKL